MNPLFNLEEYGNDRVIEAMQLLVEDLEEEFDILEQMCKSDIMIGRLVELQIIIGLVNDKYIEGFK